MYNTAGKPVLFDIYEFEIIETDITNSAAHKVAIIYTTPFLTLIENFGEVLLLAAKYKAHGVEEELEQMFTIRLQAVCLFAVIKR